MQDSNVHLKKIIDPLYLNKIRRLCSSESDEVSTEEETQETNSQKKKTASTINHTRHATTGTTSHYHHNSSKFENSSLHSHSKASPTKRANTRKMTHHGDHNTGSAFSSTVEAKANYKR